MYDPMNPYMPYDYGQPPYYPQMPQRQNAQRGMWYQVTDYEQVRKMPCAANGQPTLFFNFNTMEMWSKKIIDGQESVKHYWFGQEKETPNDNNSIDFSKLEDIQTEESPDSESQKLVTRIDTLEETVTKLLDLVTQNKEIQGENQ